MSNKHLCKLIVIIISITCFLTLPAVLAYSPEPTRCSVYNKTVVLNDMLEAESVAIVEIKKSIPYGEVHEKLYPLQPGEVPYELQEHFVSGYLICSIVEPIKNCKIEEICIYYNNNAEERKYQTGDQLYIAFESKELPYTPAIKDILGAIPQYQSKYCSTIDKSGEINAAQYLGKNESVTVNDLSKWSKKSLTDRYADYRLYAVKISETTDVFPAGQSAFSMIKKVYKGDIVLLIDRPNIDFYNHSVEPMNTISCASILLDGQEGLIDSSKILKNKNGVIRSRIKSSARLAVVSKSAYVLNSSQKGAKKTGVVRKGEVVAYTSYNKSYVRIQMPNGSYGYFPRSFLKF